MNAIAMHQASGLEFREKTTWNWLMGTSSLVTAADSQTRNAAIAYGIGFAGFMGGGWFGSLFHLTLYPNLIVALAGALAAAAASMKLSPLHRVGVQKLAVKTVGGDATDTLLLMGDHPLFPGEGGADVFTGPIFFDPPAFDELAQDDVPVTVDGYFVGHVQNPFRWYTEGGPQTAPELQKKFMSKSRNFIAPFPKATELIRVRDMLRVYLLLPNKDGPEAVAFAAKLRALKLKGSEERVLSDDAVLGIMESAGEFCQEAANFGYAIDSMNTEDINLPEELLKAAAQRAAQGDILASYEARQEAKIRMMAALKLARPELSDRDLLDDVNMLLGLALTKGINEINIRNLEQFVASPVAKVLVGIANRYLKRN